MSGYTEIVNTLKEIRTFLQQRLTPELMHSLQVALNNINNLLSDPNLQANLRSSLEGMARLLRSLNEQNVAGEIANTAKKIQEILGKIDPAAVANIIKTLDNLLSSAEKANLIENIVKALNSVSSLQDLVTITKDLVLPVKFCMYGITGATIGLAFTFAIQAFLKNKNDQKLQRSIDQLVSINMQILNVQIEQLRTQSQSFLAQLSHMEQQGSVLDEQARRAKEEKLRLLAILSPMDSCDLEMTEHMKRFCNKMLTQLYQAEIDNESMNDYLGRIGEHSSLNELVDYVAYSAQIQKIWGKTKPELSREQYNYKMVQKLYDTKVIDKIMDDLTNQLATHGGYDLYVELANSYEDGTYELAEVLKTIMLSQPEDDDFPRRHSEPAKRLWHYYAGTNALEFITTAWNNINWRQKGFGSSPLLTPVIIDVIKKRACLEFCHKTVPYLCFPYNMPRETFNGIVDIPVGIWQIVRHPRDSFVNIGKTFFTPSGLRNLGASIYAHPLRFLTTQGVTAGVATGAAYIAPKIMSKTVAVAAAKPQSLLRTPPAATSAGLSTTKIATASATAGTLSSDLAMQGNKTQAHQPENASSVELTTMNKPKIVVTAELTENLLQNLAKKNLGDIQAFYDTIFLWYQSQLATKENGSAKILARSIAGVLNASVVSKLPEEIEESRLHL